MSELEQLRADLAVLERYDKRQGTIFIRSVREEIERKIAQLEADADPWREAKAAVEYFRGFAKHRSETDVVKLVDHLTAENERLKARVAELEGGCDVLKRQHDHVFDDRERLKKRLAESERLDPARVLATAADLGWGPTVYAEMTILRGAKPYPLEAKPSAFVDEAADVTPEQAELLKTVKPKTVVVSGCTVGKSFSASANLPPVSLKRADEIRVGDVVLGGGEIRTISEVCKNAEESRVRLWGDGWGAWLNLDDLIAVVNGAMGEGETRPLKKGCDDGK